VYKFTKADWIVALITSILIVASGADRFDSTIMVLVVVIPYFGYKAWKEVFEED